MKILKILFVFIFCLILMSCGKEYTVTFDTNGGTIIESVKVKKGGKIAKPSDPIKEGYKFNGWYFNDEEWSFTENVVTNDIELTSKWESNEYKIIFDTDGGNIIEDITLKIGDKIIKPNDPVKEGHTFDGWYYNNEAWNFEENLVTENITLTSKWIVNEYTITINNEDGSILNTIILKYGDEINIEDPSKEGYVFAGWDQDLPNYMPASNLIITPIFEDAIIKLGSSGPLSGSASYYGLAVKKGIELAIEEINNSGGVKVGDIYKEFSLVDFIDDQMEAYKAANGLKTLLEKDVDLVLGAVSSGASEGLISEAKKVGIPVITPTAPADKLTVGDTGYQRNERYNVFRACYNDSYQGKYMAKYAKEAGYDKAYVIFNSDDDYSIGLKNAFVETAEANGMTVVVQGHSYGYMDYTSLWTPILEGGYDCVYIPEYYETVYNILKKGYVLGYQGVCYGGDGWDGVIQQVKEGDDASFLEKCFYTNHYFGASENEAVKNFIKVYEAKYNGEVPSIFSALGYDAVYIAKQAIEQAGSTDYDKVINALTYGTYKGLVTSNEEFSYKDGNPQKELFVITFKDGKEVEAK